MKKFILPTILAVSTALSNAQESYVSVDSVSGKVFFAKETEKQRPVASLTKVATAKLVLDWSKISNTSLDNKLIIPPSAANISGANPLNLQPGDVLSIRDAIYACLLGSDNVAAFSLANYVGYSLNEKRGGSDQPMVAFVKEMNQLALSLKMNHTKFVNPHGLESANAIGLSTATDMALLAMAAMKHDALAFIVKQKTRKVSVTKANKKTVAYDIKNTNILIGQNGIVGLKTGTTKAAGQCLITVSNKPAMVSQTTDGKKAMRNRQMIVVLLGSNDRFTRTKEILKTSWAAHEQWGKEGFLVPSSGKGLLKLP